MNRMNIFRRGAAESGHWLRPGASLILSGILLVLPGIAGNMQVSALHNHDGAHDPTGIVKCDDTYWIFTSGLGPYAMYSRDLVYWTAGQTPLSPGSFPAWITAFVPDFNGDFWAPACFYMNGRYHLYYSCSSWGSTVSCIGLMTSKSLNPESPDYAWQDKGLVVNSTASSNYNCIDPAIMRDDEGKIWLTYGSHWDGIRVVELDSLTGKVSGSTHYSVAGKGDYKTEAAYMVNHGDFYYLFFNRGECCNGINSTYYIQVGRSSSPTGPFLDKTGKDCYQGGGTTVLSTSGDKIGPGCLGYYVENNTEYVTYHYYDKVREGWATLGISNIKWDDEGWPVITDNWLDEGSYTVVNLNSSLAWMVQDCGGGEGDLLVQSPYTHRNCQKWHFQPQGNGHYKISQAAGDLLVQPHTCESFPGRQLSLAQDLGLDCQIWRVELTNRQTFVLSNKATNYIAEIPGGLTGDGDPVKTGICQVLDHQQWMILDTAISVSVNERSQVPHVRISPNPVHGDEFLILSRNMPAGQEVKVQIFTIDGRLVYRRTCTWRQEIIIRTSLAPDIYLLRVESPPSRIIKKLLIR